MFDAASVSAALAPVFDDKDQITDIGASVAVQVVADILLFDRDQYTDDVTKRHQTIAGHVVAVTCRCTGGCDR